MADRRNGGEGEGAQRRGARARDQVADCEFRGSLIDTPTRQPVPWGPHGGGEKTAKSRESAPGDEDQGQGHEPESRESCGPGGCERADREAPGEQTAGREGAQGQGDGTFRGREARGGSA